MKKIYFLIVLPLLISLFIYVFYRTQNTIINELFIYIFSAESYMALRKSITNAFPLNGYIIYSLPEGLWVFCVTLTSRSLYVKTGSREITLILVPLIFAIGLELLQLMHFTNGRFDAMDIWVSLIFWGIANYLIDHKVPRQNLFDPFNIRSFICLLSYMIVYLAHVWN
jgi:hypothetical protein